MGWAIRMTAFLMKAYYGRYAHSLRFYRAKRCHNIVFWTTVSCKRWSRLQAALWPEPRVHAQFVSFFRGNVGTKSLQRLGGTAKTKTEITVRERRRAAVAIRNPKIPLGVVPAATPNHTDEF